MTARGSAPQLAAEAIYARQRLLPDSAHPCRVSWAQTAPSDFDCVAASQKSPAPLLRIRIVAGTDHGGPALYPTPRTVNATVGFSGSFSITFMYRLYGATMRFDFR